HPLLLLGLAGADPDDVGTRAVDVRGDPGLLVGRQRAVRGRIAADDAQPGVAAAQRERQLDERALVAPAVEVHARTGPRRALAVLGHEVGAVDARSVGVAKRLERPDQRLAVGDG